MSKPFAFFYHSSQPNILYYNNDYSIHILNKKHADVLFCFFPLLSFPIKKKKKRAKLKYLSKKYGLNMANKTFRKPHNSTKDATGMCLYIHNTERLHREMQKSLNH